LTPSHNPTSPYPLPEIGKHIAYQAKREGVAARFPAPAGPKSIEGARARMAYSDQLWTALALHLVPTAKPPAAHPCYRLRAVPGGGQILARVLLYAIPEIQRFPRVQGCGSACRLVKCAQAAAGQRSGPSGTQSGHASLPWACSAAAGRLRRNNPQGQQLLARLETRYGQGQAVPLWAHQLARAVSYRRRRNPVFARDTLFFLGRRRPEDCPAARAGETAPEPHYGLSAAHTGWPLSPEITSGYAPDCRLCQALHSGKNVQPPLLGDECLLTRGVRIRVRHRNW
jgi:hypothetical protein